MLTLLVSAGPLLAQTRPPAGAVDEGPTYIRPFFLVTGERLAAARTFDATFGERALRPFWGGGVQIGFRRGFFADVAVSRFSDSGERVFVSGGEVFPLGIRLKSAITPVELTVGYRYRLTRSIAPYAGIGVGRYWYSESSDFSAAGEDVQQSHAGFLVVGGAEFRLHPWVRLGVDAQYTHIGGILGAGGVSQAFGETNLGGTAVRVKILAGR